MKLYIFLLFATVRAAFRTQDEVMLENLALRHQLAVLLRSARRLRLEPADRILWCSLSRRWSDWRSALVMIKPRHDRALASHRLATLLDRALHGPCGGPRL